MRMEKVVRRTPSHGTSLLAVVCVASGLVACGRDEDFANEPGPPVAITVTALVDENSISVSPARFGAGVVRFIIANQSDEPQEVSLRAEGEQEALVTQVTQAIPAGGTGELKLALEPGVYELETDGDDIDPGTLTVGPQRPEGPDQLLLP
ncbi:MAG: cupredoxin domain-containing protein [Actinomycetota bacterium]|nr:cupredoxin domain-containing protein [Actinomycetota bacterium]